MKRVDINTKKELLSDMFVRESQKCEVSGCFGVCDERERERGKS